MFPTNPGSRSCTGMEERGQMPQTERIRSHVDYAPGKHALPSSNLHPHKGQNLGHDTPAPICVSPPLGHWSAPVTPTLANFYDHEDYQRHHAKKSMLMRVKEKAKKWRQMLAKKRHARRESNPAPPWGVSLGEGRHGGGGHECHGAPEVMSMRELETAPQTHNDFASGNHETTEYPSPYDKITITQLGDAEKESQMKQVDDMCELPPLEKQVSGIREQPPLEQLAAIKDIWVPETTVTPATVDETATTKDKSIDQNPAGNGSGNNNTSNKTLSETVTEMLSPAYTVVSGATQTIASKIQESRPMYEMAAKQVWDKGVSMKEYLMQKLEPGEEDRALCEVINQVVSPKIDLAIPGVADNKEKAVSSSMGKEETEGTPIPAVKDKEEAVLSSWMGKQETKGSPIPVSTNPH